MFLADVVEEQVARARDLAAEVARLEVTATTADQAATVTVRPGGVVSDLQLAQRAMRYDGRALGHLLVATIRDATAQLNDRFGERARDLTGRDDIAGILQGRLPVVPEFPPPTGPAQSSGSLG